MSNPMWTGHLARLEQRFSAGLAILHQTGRTQHGGRPTAQQIAAGQAMLDMLRAAHDGTGDGVCIPHVAWELWDGYCAVVDDRSGG